MKSFSGKVNVEIIDSEVFYQLDYGTSPGQTYWTNDKEWWIGGNKLPCQTQEEFERLIKLKAFW
jgi:hypothetical protein